MIPFFTAVWFSKFRCLLFSPSIKLLLDLQGYHKWKSTPSLPSPFWENTRKYHWKKRSGIRKQSHYIVRLQTGLLYFPGSVKWTIASSSGSRTSKALGSTSKIFTWSDSPVAGPTDTVMEQECCPFEECCVEMTKTPKVTLESSQDHNVKPSNDHVSECDLNSYKSIYYMLCSYVIQNITAYEVPGCTMPFIPYHLLYKSVSMKQSLPVFQPQKTLQHIAGIMITIMNHN